MLIEEPLSWTVNVKSFQTACQVADDDKDNVDNGNEDGNGECEYEDGFPLKPLIKGCVRTVGRTPFPSPQHPNADDDYDSDDDEEEEE